MNGTLPELSHLPKRFIVTSVSNNRPQNRLPPERQARLLNQFCMSQGLAAVVSGLPQDRSKVDA